MPSVTSNRLPGDYNVISPQNSQQQHQNSSSSFPQIPDDIQTRLLHVGMRVRKNVAEGHRSGGSIPSYQPNFDFHNTSTFYGDSQQQQNKAVLATRMISAPAMFNTTPVPAGSSNRLHLKRGRGEEEDDDTDDDNDDAMDTDTNGSTNHTSNVSSFNGARRQSCDAAVKAKVFYVPIRPGRSASQQESLTEDFEDATFLASRDSLH